MDRSAGPLRRWPPRVAPFPLPGRLQRAPLGRAASQRRTHIVPFVAMPTAAPEELLERQAAQAAAAHAAAQLESGAQDAAQDEEEEEEEEEFEEEGGAEGFFALGVDTLFAVRLNCGASPRPAPARYTPPRRALWPRS
jgi:hypothetical protein